jgi:hypothetical protein
MKEKSYLKIKYFLATKNKYNLVTRYPCSCFCWQMVRNGA